MRVAYIITRAIRGGAQVHLLDLLTYSVGAIEPHVIVGDRGFLTERLAYLGIPFTVCKSLHREISPVSDFRAVLDIEAILRSLAPSLTHMHSTKAGIIGRLASWRAGIPCVFTAHGWPFSPAYGFGRRLLGVLSERILRRLTDHVINVSEYDWNLANRFRAIDRARSSVIHNGLPDVPERARPEAEPAALVIVARFSPPKDHELLLRAVRRLRSRKFRVRFVGDGPDLARIRELSKKLGLSDSIDFLGERADVPKLLAESSIFALSSRAEGLPLSIIEAMRAGLPIVATGVGGIPELVRDGVNGYLVRSGEVGAFADRLDRLLASPDRRAEFGRASREMFAAGFSIDNSIKQTLSIYSTIAGASDRFEICPEMQP